MSAGADILQLADDLIAEASAVKVAADAAPDAPARVEHPIVSMLKAAATRLRGIPDDPEVKLADVQKVATTGLPGTGAQSPSMGAGIKKTLGKSPALKTTNLGVTAGTGGAAPAAKIASDLRYVAARLREQGDASTVETQTKAAHLLNAAVGLQLLGGPVR